MNVPLFLGILFLVVTFLVIGNFISLLSYSPRHSLTDRYNRNLDCPHFSASEFRGPCRAFQPQCWERNLQSRLSTYNDQ